MSHSSKRFRDTFPEINELIVFKDFLFGAVSKRDSQAKQKVVNFLKTFINTLKFILISLLPQIQYGMLAWAVILGIGKSLIYFLNPLGIENYF